MIDFEILEVNLDLTDNMVDLVKVYTGIGRSIRLRLLCNSDAAELPLLILNLNALIYLHFFFFLDFWLFNRLLCRVWEFCVIFSAYYIFRKSVLYFINVKGWHFVNLQVKFSDFFIQFLHKFVILQNLLKKLLRFLLFFLHLLLINFTLLLEVVLLLLIKFFKPFYL